MKPRLSVPLAMTMILAMGIAIVSCQKDSSTSNPSNNTTALQTQADDQQMTTTETENVTNDVNATLANEVTLNGNAHAAILGSGTTAVNSVTKVNGVDSAVTSVVCDATVVYDTASDPRTITITYNGTNCWGNRTRTGTVVVSIAKGVHWLDQGATVTVNIQNLLITRVRDNKTITLNGWKHITNVSGGSLKDLASLGTITHTISDSLAVTFSDNSQRVWQSSKQRVFTYSNGLVLTTTGTGSTGNHDGVAEWGVNRAGVGFTSIITQPMVIRQDCDFRLTAGAAQVLRSDSLNTTVTFGLDVNGNPTSCPGLGGSYYLSVVWVSPNGRSSNPIILPY